MQHQRLSTPEASKALGIPVHVITYWLGQIPYPAVQDEQGQWRLTDEALSVLQAVKRLKESNHSMESIRAHVKELQDAQPGRAPAAPRPAAPVAPPSPPAPPAPAAPAPQAVAPPAPAAPVPAAAQPQAPAPVTKPVAKPAAPAPLTLTAGNDLVAQISRAVTDVVRQETTLATRYAQAAHHIGKLETENKHLRAMLTDVRASRDEARAKLAELEAKAPEKPKSKLWAWLTMAALL